MQIAGWNPSPLARSDAIREFIRAGDTRARTYIYIYSYIYMPWQSSRFLRVPTSVRLRRPSAARAYATLIAKRTNAHVERDVYGICDLINERINRRY